MVKFDEIMEETLNKILNWEIDELNKALEESQVSEQLSDEEIKKIEKDIDLKLLKFAVREYYKEETSQHLGIITDILKIMGFEDYQQQSMFDEDTTVFFNKDFTEMIQFIYTEDKVAIEEVKNCVGLNDDEEEEEQE